MRFFKYGAAVALATVVSPCNAQTTTDAAQTISQLLSALGPIPFTHNEQYQTVCIGVSGDPPRFHSDPCTKTRSVTSSAVLTASNIHFVKSDPITFDQIIRTEVPSELTTDSRAWVNCSASIPANDSETLSVAFQRGNSMAISTQISHAQSEQLNFSWKISDSLSIGGNVQVTDTITKGTIDTNTYQETVTRTHAISVSLPGQKAYGVVLETWPVNYSATFHTTATVDADLSPNDRYHYLSDVIDEGRRTFPIAGTIGFVDAAEGVTLSWDIQFEPSFCPTSSAGLITIPISNLGAHKLVGQGTVVP